MVNFKHHHKPCCTEVFACVCPATPRDGKPVRDKPDDLPKSAPTDEKVAGHRKDEEEDSLHNNFDEIIRMIIETKYVSSS